MARKAIPVEKARLCSIIKQIEANGPHPKGRVALYNDAAIEYNKQVKSVKPLTTSVVGLRVLQWGVKIITPSQKGRKAGTKGGFGGTRVRVPKKDKFAANKAICKSFATLRHKMETMKDNKGKLIAARFLPLLDKAEAGSRTAAQKLHCIECSGWSTTEVTNCSCICSLWAFRPYQNGSVDEEVPACSVEDLEVSED